MTAPEVPDRIAEIRARTEAATPGPWQINTEEAECPSCSEYSVHDHGLIVTSIEIPGYDWPVSEVIEISEPTWQFLVHARFDIPWLLDEVERLQGQITRQMLRIECADYDDNDWG